MAQRGQHEPPWDQLGPNTDLPKTEKLAFRFDRNANFMKMHFSRSPTTIIKKNNLRSLLGRLGEAWKLPWVVFWDALEGQGTPGRPRKPNPRQGQARKSHAKAGPNQEKPPQGRPKAEMAFARPPQGRATLRQAWEARKDQPKAGPSQKEPFQGMAKPGKAAPRQGQSRNGLRGAGTLRSALTKLSY